MCQSLQLKHDDIWTMYQNTKKLRHLPDTVFRTVMASRITGQSCVCLIVCSYWQQRNNFLVAVPLCGEPLKTGGIVTRKMLPFDDVIMPSSHRGPPTSGRLIKVHSPDTYLGFFPSSPLNGVIVHIWGPWYQKQVSQARICNCIPSNTVGCNYLSLPEIRTSGAKVLIYVYICIYVYASCRLPKRSCIMYSNNYVHWMVAASP